METLPEWALKHKAKGTEIRNFGGRYYLYQISSKWDSKLRKSRKVTGKFLGRITPEGLNKPKREKLEESVSQAVVRIYGSYYFAAASNSELISFLKKQFPLEWESIFVFAIERLFHSSPMKNVGHFYASSYLSEACPNAHVSPRSLSAMLESLGQKRGSIREFMKEFITGTDFAVIDLTHVFSLSEGVISATLGHNHEKDYTPQVNLTLIFSLDKTRPAFYRMVPGSIRDVSVIPATLLEAGIKKAVLIGDKGFASAANTDFLEQQSMEYILPLKRNSSIIDYTPLQKADRRKLGGYFFFEKRCIWHYEKHLEGGRRLIVFLDEKLKAEEEKDFLSRVDERALELDKYYRKQHTLGTIAILTNTSFSPQRVYDLLKSRVEIELVFDALKNVLNADRTYMRDDTHLEGWMFVNFIALLIYYQLYRLLLDKNLLSKYSPKDLIMQLSRVHRIKVGEKWYTTEMPKTARVLSEKLGFAIPIT
jgi:hypothetical protein